MRSTTIGFVLVLALFTGACGGGGEDPTVGGGTETATTDDGAAESPAAGDGEITATETEFAINLDQESVPAGQVTFQVENEGEIEHDFIVIQTDMAVDSLPVEDNQVNLEAEGLAVVEAQDSIAAGSSASVTTDLEAGPYVTICNIPAHYESGMYAGLEVT